MNCNICNIRSSVGFCVECKTLVCEECGIVCERCGKMACSKHIYVTSSGRQICTVCQAERREKRSKQQGITPSTAGSPKESTSFESIQMDEPGLSATATAAAGAELPVSTEALTASARAPIAPWKLSLYAACASLLSVVVILFVPAFWSMLLGADSNTALPFLIILVPLLPAFLSILWAVGGIFTSPYIEDRAKCLIGFGVAIIAIIIGFVAASRAPAYLESIQPEMLKGTRTEDMTPEQLENWRKEQLRRFSR